MLAKVCKRVWLTRFVFVGVLIMRFSDAGTRAHAEQLEEPLKWESTIESGNWEKAGLAALHRPDYQYETIGLGGTTMRIGPDGLTYPGAPNVIPSAIWMPYWPYLGYEYWWNEQSHRVIPFDLVACYGDKALRGTIQPAGDNSFQIQRLFSAEGANDAGYALSDPSHTVAQRFDAATPFDSLSARMVAPDNALVPSAESGITFSLFKWNTDYETSVSGTPLARRILSLMVDRQWLEWDLDARMPAGEYLWVMSDPTGSLVGPYVTTSSSERKGAFFVNGGPVVAQRGPYVERCFGTWDNNVKDFLDASRPLAQSFISYDPLTGVKLGVAKSETSSASFDLHLYAWNSRYETTLEGSPVASAHFDAGFVKRDEEIIWDFEKTLPAGQYLIVMTNLGSYGDISWWRNVTSSWRDTDCSAYEGGEKMPGDRRLWYKTDSTEAYPAMETYVISRGNDSGDPAVFSHHLDISKGLVSVDTVMSVGTSMFSASREAFVTPEGVLVLRVSDAPPREIPFRLLVRPRVGWTVTSSTQDGGLIVTGTQEGACVAYLAVTADSAEFIDQDRVLIGRQNAGESITFYIAPGSSYKDASALEEAWEKAQRARERGHDALLNDTIAWWDRFYQSHEVRLPDMGLAKWYARSLYYHGVFFGETSVPPGAYGTNPTIWGGAIWPEYDLVFSQLAMLYTNHVNESAGIVDWIHTVLPKAKQNAASSTLYDHNIAYGAGAAKYTAFIGWDGAIPTPGTPEEGVHLYNNYPNANVAAMALYHADWTLNEVYIERARSILLATAKCAAEDLLLDEQHGAYLDKRKPDILQQLASKYLLTESTRRGLGDPSWADMAENVYIPKGVYKGNEVLVAWPGDATANHGGDVPWLHGVWWWGITDPADPVVRPSFDKFRETQSKDYVFNRGTFSVIASKMRSGEEAHEWLSALVAPDVIHDESSIIEMVQDQEDFKRTPEIAAHGAFICSLVQMLVDPESEDQITVFPALPRSWQETGVSFSNLAIKGNIHVSADLTPVSVRVKVVNRSHVPVQRSIRVRLPMLMGDPGEVPEKTTIDGQWIMIPALTLPPSQSVTFELP